LALHPDPQNALLISFGVGSTAKALTDTRSLKRIDVVDISRDVLEMNRIVYPDPRTRPLNDPRVHVTIDDGRYFLQTTENRYDLITSEPPPPKHAGVVNLYSQEYFQLIYDRLSEGGICTYWLPVHHLTPDDTRAIIHAFCNAFEDASLWAGAGFNWVLVGTRNAQWTQSETVFRRQWDDPVVKEELRTLGLERPEQLGALFMSDADHLQKTIRNTPPLTDNYPKRLSVGFFNREAQQKFYHRWMNPLLTRERFEQSAFIQKAWPPALRERTLDYFDAQRLLEASLAPKDQQKTDQGTRIATLHTLLTQTDLRTLPLWHLHIQDDLLKAVHKRLEAGDDETPYLPYLAAQNLADRQFDRAARFYGRAQEQDPALRYLYLYALCMADRCPQAERLANQWRNWILQQTNERFYYQWLSETFALKIPIP
ncbi:MAG: spermidine synthase, partial [bacterium]|nr:spermidine synthase [bacterium]